MYVSFAVRAQALMLCTQRQQKQSVNILQAAVVPWFTVAATLA
jgi:hypothetical protein